MSGETTLCLCGDLPRSHGPNGCTMVGCGCEVFRPQAVCPSWVSAGDGHQVICVIVEAHQQHANGGFRWT